LPPLILGILSVAVCGAAGFFAGSAFYSPSPETAGRPTAEPRAVVAELKVPTAAESAFISEWEQLHSAHGDDFGAMYAAFKDMKDAFRRRAFRYALIAEWSERDPQAAMAYILKNDQSTAGQLAREWLRRDPQGAITSLLAGDDKSRERLRSLLSEIARVAPGRLGEVAAVLKSSTNRWDSTATDAFAIFAAKDPDAARAAAEAVSGPLRGQALAGVAKAWAEKDGAAALAWAQAMPAGEARDAALKAVLAGWAKTDPIAALGKLDLVPPGGEENYHASDVGAQVLREAAKKDWNATLAWLRENPGKLGRSSLDGLQGEVSRRLGADTATTMRLLATGGLPGLEMVFANSILNEGYAQRDAIWWWLDGQPPTDTTRNLRGSLLNAIGWKEPEAALGFLEKIPDTPENAQLLERGVMSLVNGGSQMERFDSLLEKAPAHIRARLIEVGLNFGGMNARESSPSFDPARWVELLDEIPAERRSNASIQLASGWAASDPEAAVRWASALPDPAARDGAIGSIAATWANHDPIEAARWVDTLPAGEARDGASAGLSNALARSEPETAWVWAASIQARERRFGAMQLAYMGLMKKDPAIAEQMLTGANLPAAEIKALREGYRPGMENQFFPR
jgi:hypothetical protein